MSRFKQTHKNKYVTLRDAITAFFSAVHENKQVHSNSVEAYLFLYNCLAEIIIDARMHNEHLKSQRTNISENVSLSSFKSWAKLKYDHKDGPEAVINYTTTTQQYILISSNGALEIHQMTGGVFLKFDIPAYRDNKYKSLILSKPGFDGKNVWGEESISIEYFSKYANVLAGN